MPTIRETMPQQGSFTQALFAFHENPTFENLMEAYTLADMSNRKLLEAALKGTRILQTYDLQSGSYLNDYLDLDEVHQMWLKLRMGYGIIESIESLWPEMGHLDDEAT